MLNLAYPQDDANQKPLKLLDDQSLFDNRSFQGPLVIMQLM